MRVHGAAALAACSWSEGTGPRNSVGSNQREARVRPGRVKLTALTALPVPPVPPPVSVPQPYYTFPPAPHPFYSRSPLLPLHITLARLSHGHRSCSHLHRHRSPRSASSPVRNHRRSPHPAPGPGRGPSTPPPAAVAFAHARALAADVRGRSPSLPAAIFARAALVHAPLPLSTPYPVSVKIRGGPVAQRMYHTRPRPRPLQVRPKPRQKLLG